MQTYKIVRFYASKKQSKIIKKGISLKDARKHCNDDSTQKIGEWFDGYYKE